MKIIYRHKYNYILHFLYLVGHAMFQDIFISFIHIVFGFFIFFIMAVLNKYLSIFYIIFFHISWQDYQINFVFALILLLTNELEPIMFFLSIKIFLLITDPAPIKTFDIVVLPKIVELYKCLQTHLLCTHVQQLLQH